MTVSRRLAALFAMTLSLACSHACTDDDDAAIGVDKLTSSECLDAPGTRTDADNAHCVISQREGKKLGLQVFGLRSLCLAAELLEDVPWHAVAREEGSGRVVVSVDWPSDQTPACGSCVYNFKVELGPRDWADTTELKFEVRPCPTCGVDDFASATLGTTADQRSTHACGDEQLDAGA